MSTLFGILGVARSGLVATQTSIQTAANNVANAGTEGYTRQRVDLAESLPETLPTIGQVGTGVQVDGVRRLRDRYLDQQYYLAEQSLGERQAEHATLTQIESLLSEPSEAGLQTSLSAFFTSLSDLASYPTDLTSRRAALEQGRALAADFHRLSTGLADMKRNLESEIEQRVADANQLLREIGTLNGQIQAVTVAGGSPNALLDKRDSDLDALAKLVGIVRTDRADGTVQISLAGGGGLLVDGTTAATLGAQLSTTSDVYQLTIGTTVVTPAGGTLDGLLHSRNDDGEYVKYTETQLDTLAATLIEQMNSLQGNAGGLVGRSQLTSTNAVTGAGTPLASAGLPFTPSAGSLTVFTYDASDAVTGTAAIAIDPATMSLSDVATALSGVPGLSAGVSGGRLTVTAQSGTTFRFAGDTAHLLPALGANGVFTGSNARSIAVSSELDADPRLLGSASVDAATGAVAPGDTTVIRAMAALRDAKVFGGTATLEDFYGEAVGVVGARTAALGRMSESQELVVQTVANQREQVSGVSLNEEMADLVRFQYAFQASARMISVVDDLLNTVVNGMLR